MSLGALGTAGEVMKVVRGLKPAGKSLPNETITSYSVFAVSPISVKLTELPLVLALRVALHALLPGMER